MNTESANTEPLLVGKYGVRQDSGPNICIRWSTPNLALCGSLFKDTLFHIHHWFITSELPATSTVTHARMKCISHMRFLHQAHPSFLVLRNTGQDFSTAPRGHFKQQAHQQKGQRYEKRMVLNKTRKGCVYSLSPGTRGQSVTLFNLSWATQISHCYCTWSRNDHRGTKSVGLGVANTFQQVGNFANTESTNDEDQL